MDIFLIVVASLFMFLGIVGSFLAILPGPLSSWIGLLIFHLTEAVPMNWTLLIITLVIALLIWLLDYIIPDYVHVLIDGKIVKSGSKELAYELEEKGYDWIKEEIIS